MNDDTKKEATFSQKCRWTFYDFIFYPLLMFICAKLYGLPFQLIPSLLVTVIWEMLHWKYCMGTTYLHWSPFYFKFHRIEEEKSNDC